jgi:LysR family nitrogen assimilation transcriptional regulator
VRQLSEPALHIQLTTAVSSLRPTTLTQQATLGLITEVTKEWLTA